VTPGTCSRRRVWETTLPL